MVQHWALAPNLGVREGVCVCVVKKKKKVLQVKLILSSSSLRPAYLFLVQLERGLDQISQGRQLLLLLVLSLFNLRGA